MWCECHWWCVVRVPLMMCGVSTNGDMWCVVSIQLVMCGTSATGDVWYKCNQWCVVRVPLAMCGVSANGDVWYECQWWCVVRVLLVMCGMNITSDSSQNFWRRVKIKFLLDFMFWNTNITKKKKKLLSYFLPFTFCKRIFLYFPYCSSFLKSNITLNHISIIIK